ncbi:MAG TPA: hypothetical protein VIV58_21840 [Kofleriaceae bacterium]
MKTSWLVLGLVGCGAKPAAPLEKPTPLTPDELRLSTPVPSRTVHSFAASPSAAEVGPGLALPRPPLETALEPPDVGELGRWPLTVAEHPALEPHFDIAAALAETGISWTDLCARGAQHRHLATHQELVAYLDAWCSVIPGDYGAAITKLGLVRHAANRQLVDALRLDVPAIVAAHGPAHDLESFLRAGGFLDVATVDLASAAYFEVGKLDEAAETNRLAEEIDPSPTERVRCSRLMREIADTTGGAREDALAELRLAAMVPDQDVRTPLCRAQYEIARCWKHNDCGAYWARLVPGADAADVGLLDEVYESWTSLHTANEWLNAARRLTYARPLRDRYTLLVPAVEASLRLSRCNLSILSELQTSIQWGLGELSAPAVKTTSMSTRQVYEASLTKQELALIPADERRQWERRLETALAQAQSLWKLDDATCAKYIAAFPPVQP